MVKFIYSNNRFAAKPKEKNVIAALQKPENYTYAKLETVSDIMALIDSGRAWRAGLYDDGIDSFKKANVKAAQILALDFDASPFTPDNVIEYAESIGIAPSAWYYSYSQGIKSGYNFRVLWVLDEQIKPIQYETIYAYMLEQFQDFNPDRSTKDAGRLWFGTMSGATVLRNSPLKLSAIGWLGVCDKLRNNQPTQKAKKAKKGCENSFFDDDVDMKPCYITQSFDWQGSLAAKCYLWDKWKNGEYMTYNQRLTLFTNLKFIKYGNNNKSVLKDVLDIYHKYSNVYEGHTCTEEQIRYMFAISTLHAIGIVKIAGEDELLTVKQYFEREPHEAYNTTKKGTLEELDELMKKEMPRLLSDDNIWYIKSQTASGKTYHVIQWLLRQDLNKNKVIYSAPRYSNLYEFKDRFLEAYEEYSDKKPIYDFDEVITLIPRGNYTEKDKLLMEAGFPPKTRQEARYREMLKMINSESKGLFLATHECIAHLRTCPADHIIIDENIENALITKTVLELDELYSLIPYLETQEKEEELIDFLHTIKDMERGEVVDISALKHALTNLDTERYIAASRCISGIGKVFEYQKEQPLMTIKTSYVGKKRIENPAIMIRTKSTLIDDAIKLGTPIKLLSATPKRETLNTFYGTDVIKLYAFPYAKNKGQIIQLMGITGGKGINGSNTQKIIDYVKHNVPIEEQEQAYVLTFKDSIKQWKDAGFKIPSVIEDGEEKYLHLSNNSGLDSLKGKIVIVAGKFDYNDDEYYDYYYSLHPNSKVKPQRVPTKITLATRTSTIRLWNDEELRKMQLENIELYLAQSAGRARALRESKAKVYLVCDFAIPDSDVFK